MKRNGFTLIELILVIGIISLLSVAALTILNPVTQFQKANDSKRKSDLAQIQRALEQYYQDNNQYPSSTDQYELSVASWDAPWPPYLNLVPKDPNYPSRKYVYYSTSDGQGYFLYANLERGSNDPQICSNLTSDGECDGISRNGININSCGGPCNYGVTSANKLP